MFGHDKDAQDDAGTQSVTQPADNGLLGVDDTPQDLTQTASTDMPVQNEPSSAPEPMATPNDSTAATSSPLSEPTLNDGASTSLPEDGANDDLLNIKREALEELSPLIDHLNQDPDEKFRTTMMMIQASDNKVLISSAFAAAKQITDDKRRAQALLDIVNEINYFTQKDS